MKKFLIVLFLAAFLGCKNDNQHHYTVICNGYKDTVEVVAKYWRTELVDTGRTVTLFHADCGNSQIYNVDKIIAKEDESD